VLGKDDLDVGIWGGGEGVVHQHILVAFLLLLLAFISLLSAITSVII
jgi:hypothetical protein